MQEKLCEEFHHHSDYHTRAFSILYRINRWMAIRLGKPFFLFQKQSSFFEYKIFLDMITALFSIVTILSCVLFKSKWTLYLVKAK